MQVLLQALQVETPKQGKTPFPEMVGDVEDASDFAVLFAEDAPEVSLELDTTDLPNVTPEEKFLSEDVSTSPAEPAQPAIDVAEPVVAPIASIAPRLAERDPTQSTEKTPLRSELANDEITAKPVSDSLAAPKSIDPELPPDMPKPTPEGAVAKAVVSKAASESTVSVREALVQRSAAVEEPREAPNSLPREPEQPVAAARDPLPKLENERAGAQPILQAPRAHIAVGAKAQVTSLKDTAPTLPASGPDQTVLDIGSPVSAPATRATEAMPASVQLAADPAISTDEKPRRTRGKDGDIRATVALTVTERSLPTMGTASHVSPSPQSQLLQAKPDVALIKDQPLQTSETTLDALLQADKIEAERPLSREAPRVEPTIRSVVTQVVNTITKVTAEGMVELRLQPEELGRVRMTMLQSDLGMVVQISAERPETLDLMRRNIDMLEAELADRGFSDLSFSFEQETEQQGQHAGSERVPSEDGYGRDGPGERIDVVQNHSPGVEGRIDIRL
ncbi:MAG: flagellar hook-length control protein FliK [Paracoccaceae bacterium]|nr:flagellar hook-length control protein FliK [Paracoccaceae bacterium]